MGTKSPFYAHARIGARSSYDGDKLEATAIERMRRINDLHIRGHGYVSLSPRGTLEPLRGS